MLLIKNLKKNELMEIKLPWKNDKVKGRAGSGENLSPKVCVEGIWKNRQGDIRNSSI